MAKRKAKSYPESFRKEAVRLADLPDRTATDVAKELGFDKWFQNYVNSERMEGLEIARVIAVHKDSYTITNGKNYVFAELVGKMLYGAVSPIDYPAVGDWVFAIFYDENTFSIIHEIIQRKSLLKRKTPEENRFSIDCRQY